jgi:hypothetical protein
MPGDGSYLSIGGRRSYALVAYRREYKHLTLLTTGTNKQRVVAAPRSLAPDGPAKTKNVDILFLLWLVCTSHLSRRSEAVNRFTADDYLDS